MSDDRNRQFFERAIGLAIVASLVLSCVSVTGPFIIPTLWGIVIAVSTWPIYRRLRDLLGGYRKVAATIMTLVLLMVLVAPIVLLSVSLAENVRDLGGLVAGLSHSRLPPPPPWVRTLPIVGARAQEAWHEASANMGAFLEQLQPWIASVTGWLLARTADLALAMIEFLVAILIAGVLYVTGEPGVQILRRFIRRIASEREVALLELAGRTIRGVALGVIGTAIVQGAVTSIGLLIADAPGPVLLGFITFVVSVAQLPTSLVLLPIAGWLAYQDQTWQAIFVTVWSIAVVNMVDNLIRPYLISQGARLPFILITVGVLGGLLTWGFIGIFLGATLLAVSYTLFRGWLDDDRYNRPWPKPVPLAADPPAALAPPLPRATEETR